MKLIPESARNRAAPLDLILVSRATAWDRVSTFLVQMAFHGKQDFIDLVSLDCVHQFDFQNQ